MLSRYRFANAVLQHFPSQTEVVPVQSINRRVEKIAPGKSQVILICVIGLVEMRACQGSRRQSSEQGRGGDLVQVQKSFANMDDGVDEALLFLRPAEITLPLASHAIAGRHEQATRTAKCHPVIPFQVLEPFSAVEPDFLQLGSFDRHPLKRHRDTLEQCAEQQVGMQAQHAFGSLQALAHRSEYTRHCLRLIVSGPLGIAAERFHIHKQTIQVRIVPESRIDLRQRIDTEQIVVVEKENHFASRRPHSRIAGFRGSLRYLVPQQPDASRQFFLPGIERHRGTGPIVHHDDIPFIEALSLDTGNSLTEQFGTIVSRDYNGDLHTLLMSSRGLVQTRQTFHPVILHAGHVPSGARQSRHTQPVSIDSTARRLCQPGRAASSGNTARTAAIRCPLLLNAQPRLLRAPTIRPATPCLTGVGKRSASRIRSDSVRTFSRCAATGLRRVALPPCITYTPRLSQITPIRWLLATSRVRKWTSSQTLNPVG